jgi:8-oxo-dGTP pyrophosphatase MutT (NUDIX family)
MPPHNFLADTNPLRSDHAAAAIILCDDGRYLLQLRDDIPGIFYPGFWGCFGGAISKSETAAQAIRRELSEELELSAAPSAQFVTFDFDLSTIGQGRVTRVYFEYVINDGVFRRLSLHEGADMRRFTRAELFGLSNVTPYDSFALWLHSSRDRFKAC